MIILSYSKMQNPGFQNALRKLYLQDLPGRTAFDLRVLSNRIDKELKEADRIRFGFLGDYCEKNEDGSLKMQQDEEGNDIAGSVVPVAEKEDEFKKVWIDYLNTKVEIKGRKFNAEDFEGANLSAQDLDLLSGIIDFGEEEELPELGASESHAHA